MTSAVACRGKGDPGGGHGGVLRDAITEAMRAETNESPGIKSKIDDVAAAVAAVKRDLIGELLLTLLLVLAGFFALPILLGAVAIYLATTWRASR